MFVYMFLYDKFLLGNVLLSSNFQSLDEIETTLIFMIFYRKFIMMFIFLINELYIVRATSFCV